MFHPKSKIQNPKSRRRRGVTIVEVLFAILITTVGLFSALAIFPFASSQARRARLNDMFAAAGRSAFHNFDVRGMRRPDRWMAWDRAPAVGSPRFVPYLSLNNRPAHESICIDPRFIAAQTTMVGGNPFLPPSARVFSYYGSEIDTSYMRRITLKRDNAAVPLPMSLFQADTIFTSTDDLGYERDEKDKAQPANQSTHLFQDATTKNEWARRLSDGRISWIATLVPQFDVSGAANDNYTLSIVMLQDRTQLVFDATKEREVFGQLLSTGASGGEILLSSVDPAKLALKPNDWIMLTGTYIYDTTTTPPRQASRFQWYRISDCDIEPELDSANSIYHLNATIVGSDWNLSYTQVIPPAIAITGATPVRVTIVEGAYAVYEKTVRLEYGSQF